MGTLPISSRPRVVSLDVLRDIAILLVLLHHAIVFHGDIGFLGTIVRPLCELGWTGVDLFFVLSGFLIGGLIFKEVQRTGSFRAGRFLVRRAFKIWPAYFAPVGFGLVKALHHHRPFAELMGQFWPNFVQVQNYKINFALPHTWSLAVEEHFYLLLAALVGATVSLRADHIARYGAVFLVAAMGIITGYRLYVGLAVPFRLELHFAATHVRADSLLAGVLLAHQATYNPLRWARWLRQRWWLFGVGVVLILPAAWVPRISVWMHTVGYSVIYIGYSMVLIAALSFGASTGDASHVPKGRTWSLLAGASAWVGVSSYGIYLWHADLGRMPVEFWLAPQLQKLMPNPLAWSVGMIVYIVLAVGAGYLLSILIERPALLVREKCFPAAADRSRDEKASHAACRADPSRAVGQAPT